MKPTTKQSKQARKGFEQGLGKEEMLNKMFHIIQEGKQGLDTFIHELGIMIASRNFMLKGQSLGLFCLFQISVAYDIDELHSRSL